MFSITRFTPTVVAGLLLLAPVGIGGWTGTARAQSLGQTAGAQTASAPSRQTIKLDLTCGRVTELTADTIMIKPDTGTAKRIRVAARTRFVARSFQAARAGLKEGSFAAARGGDEASGSLATRVTFGDIDFCQESVQGQTERFIGAVASSTPNSLTIRQSDGDLVALRFTQATRFYVNGRLEQNPPAFKLGEPARVLAHRETDGSYNALVVAVKVT